MTFRPRWVTVERVAQTLADLAGRAFVQCRQKDAVAVAEIAAAHDAGLVITGPDAPAVAADLLDRHGFGGPVLCDADRYSGQRRHSAGGGVRVRWYERQRGLGLVPLSDSGYLAARNLPGLRTILRATQGQQPAIALLPLSARWFVSNSVCDALAGEINAVGVPVAVVLEHRGDPFGAQYLLRGFLRLLDRVAVPLLLLRSDVSALGALCHGAHAAALGTRSALRHLYPVDAGGGRSAGVSTFLEPLMSYHVAERVEEIVTGLPLYEHLWPCPCPECEGRPPVFDAVPPAVRHSLHAQLSLHAYLSRAETREASRSTWHEACSHALSLHEDAAELLARHRIPAALRNWFTLTDDPLAEHRAIVHPAGERTPANRR